ncbi:hypothetical protein PG999_008897 [Apiospora kogelbergensis]|uniref:Uncharacterized protein n=1 Tax=Apiospora kogelbergensis TaxID=1337665 RepID=A0AAW0QLX1_9PEZI
MKKLTVVIPIRPASRVSQIHPPPPLPQQTEQQQSQPRAVDADRAMVVAANGEVMNDFDSTRCASVSSSSSCTCDVLSPLSTHCEYCIRNGLDHHYPPSHRMRDWMATMEEGRLYDASITFMPPHPEDQRRSVWMRYTENEGMLGCLEFMIALQMRLLAIVVPTALLFVFLFVWYESHVDSRGLFG